MLFALTGCSTTPKPCKLLGCGSGQLIGGRHRFEKKKKRERQHPRDVGHGMSGDGSTARYEGGMAPRPRGEAPAAPRHFGKLVGPLGKEAYGIGVPAWRGQNPAISWHSRLAAIASRRASCASPLRRARAAARASSQIASA
jgi:hypothetical protein